LNADRVASGPAATGGARGMPRAAWAGLVGLYLLLAGTGLTWGLPNDHSWSNDDIAPQTPLKAARYFREETFKYPYLQLFIDRALYEPYLRWAGAKGYIEPGCRPIRRDCFEDRQLHMGRLLLISRLRSLVMGAGIVATVAALAAALFGAEAAFFAALLAVVNETFGFYAKMGNLDVPYCFWFLLSALAYTRVLRGGGRRAWLAFGLLSGAALATKEGIVGAYVLMGGAMVLALLRPRASGWPRREVWTEAVWHLGLLSLGLFGVYGLVQNVLFNWPGFVDHVRHWVGGPGIEDFNDAYQGPLWLARLAWTRAREGAGWPLLLFLVAALVLGLGDRGTPRTRAAAASTGPVSTSSANSQSLIDPRKATLWLVLPIVSYLLFTILPIRFVYPRFMLPIYLLAAPIGGLLAARLWFGARAAGAHRPPLAGRLVVILVVVYSALYSWNVSLALGMDTRVATEQWLATHLAPDSVVVAFGQEAYFPRIELLDLDSEIVDWKKLAPYKGASDSEDTDEDLSTRAAALDALLSESDARSLTPGPAAPDWLLLSSRSLPPADTSGAVLIQRLLAGDAGYDLRWDSDQAFPGVARRSDRPSPLGRWLPGSFVESRVSPRIWVLQKRS